MLNLRDVLEGVRWGDAATEGATTSGGGSSKGAITLGRLLPSGLYMTRVMAMEASESHANGLRNWMDSGGEAGRLDGMTEALPSSSSDPGMSLRWRGSDSWE